jgi:3'-5' exoribonuclease
MGPRLPGDRGPSARPDKPKSLTHNPFAALAAKVEAARPEAPPVPDAEPQAESPTHEAAPEAPPQAAPVEAASAPVTASEPSAAPETSAPTGGDAPQ